jgi:hypothetical protein
VLAGDAVLGDTAPVVLRGECTVPTRTLPSAAEAVETLAAAQKATSDLDTPAARIAQTRYEGAAVLAALVSSGLPAEVVLPISVVVFGDVAWAHLPVEPFTCFGERIRAASPFRDTRIVGYTDGYFGYLADDIAHREGRYEALGSMFDADAGSLVVDATVALLRRARI